METLIRFFKGFGWQRTLTHLLLASVTLTGIYLTTLYAPHGEAAYIFTIGCGYVCLLLLCVTLVIGPLNLIRKRLNPVNIDLRRDIGIWAGINGCLHVTFALIERNRGNVLGFFFRLDGRPLANLTGLSNWIGLFATIILIALLLTSNALMLRKLKGKRWKKLQQLNYVLTTLVFLHTFAYQTIGGREKPFVDATAIALMFVLLIQLIGVNVYQQRRAAHLVHR